MTSRKLEVIADPDRPTIVTRRVLDAPRALVFEAFTRPEHLKRWLGPAKYTWIACEIDLRVGGGYRWVHRDDAGNVFAFHGTYREVVRPERIVATFVFEAFPDDEAVDTVTFEERDGRTMVTTTTVHRTIEGRNGHLAGGMEAGMTEGYARLDELLPELARG